MTCHCQRSMNSIQLLTECIEDDHLFRCTKTETEIVCSPWSLAIICGWKDIARKHRKKEKVCVWLSDEERARWASFLSNSKPRAASLLRTTFNGKEQQKKIIFDSFFSFLFSLIIGVISLILFLSFLFHLYHHTLFLNLKHNKKETMILPVFLSSLALSPLCLIACREPWLAFFSTL